MLTSPSKLFLDSHISLSVHFTMGCPMRPLTTAMALGPTQFTRGTKRMTCAAHRAPKDNNLKKAAECTRLKRMRKLYVKNLALRAMLACKDSRCVECKVNGEIVQLLDDYCCGQQPLIFRQTTPITSILHGFFYRG